MNKRTAYTLAACFFILLTTPLRAQDTVAAINDILKTATPAGTSTGIIIQDLDSGTILYSMNPDKIFIPASNMKIVTAAAAILALGADYKFNTDFHVKDFKETNGAAAGLFVKGFGDPTLTEDFFTSAQAGMDAIAAQLARAGLRKITGEFILSGSLFTDNERPASWEADDMSWCYATRPGALAVAKNCLKVKVGTIGGKPAVTLDPPVDAALLDIKVGVGKKTAVSIKQNANGRFSISGSIRKGASATYEYPVPYPTKFFGAVLSGALKRAGITVTAAMEEAGSTPAGYRIFQRIQSPELTTVLSEMQKNSDNFVAEQVFRVLGTTRGSRGGTHASGAFVIESIMAKYKLGSRETLSVVDGSGLSRLNRLTPRVLLAVLSAFYNSYLRQSYLDLLAEPGGVGTLKKRLRGTTAEGRLWAKTGALRGACSLSGYFRRGDGRMAAFVMIFNDYKVHSNEIRVLQDRLVLKMLEF